MTITFTNIEVKTLFAAARVGRALILILSVAASCWAQNTAPGTRIQASEIREPAVVAASVRVVLPNGAVVYAKLDPDVFTIDNTTAPPTLRLKMPVVSINAPLDFLLTRNSDMTFSLPPIAAGKNVSVYRNGRLMWGGTDYTITGSTLRFLEGQQPCCEPDELIILTVWR